MMLNLRSLVCALCLLTIPGSGQTKTMVPPPNGFLALNYHDIPDDVRSEPDRYSLDAGKLIREFEWLQEQGYHPVSLTQIVASREQGIPLPPKAVLLTFDDGYTSFYTRVYPLLKLFNYPALLAVVGRWLETPEGQTIDYDSQRIPRSRVMSWDQLREVAASGLVEIASHSFDLHHGILGNPQGNKQPAAITRLYDPNSGTHENDARMKERIRADLEKNSSLLERRLGRRPRAMVWPYGRYNGETIAIARSVGMPVSLTLDDGFNEPGPQGTPLSLIKRTIVMRNPNLEEFAFDARNLSLGDPVRAFHVELDRIYDPDPSVQEENLSRLLEQISKVKANTVYLQAFSDTDRDGSADAMYFPNRHLPMRADLFNRVAWQLSSRGGAFVFAWMPVSAFRPAKLEHSSHLGTDAGGLTVEGESRLFALRETIFEIYEDMAKYAIFDGILFDDEPRQVGPPLQAADSAHSRISVSGLSVDSAGIKTSGVKDFTLELLERCKRFRAPLKSARRISGASVLASNPGSGTGLGSNLASMVSAYDHTVVITQASNVQAGTLVQAIRILQERLPGINGKAGKVVFEIHKVQANPHGRPEIDSITALIKSIALSSTPNFGLYPDEFPAESPEEKTIRPWFSLQNFPKTLPRDIIKQYRP